MTMISRQCTTRAALTLSRIWNRRHLVRFKHNRCLYMCSRHAFRSPSLESPKLPTRGSSPFRNCSTVSASEFLDIRPDVAAALSMGDAVVALESTIITHGMPYPDNVRTAMYLEDVIRAEGVLPATVAALRGKLCIGLTRDQLETLASTHGEAVKTSRRDLAWVLSQKQSGGTTVSGTMIAAHLASIPIFVTGGIGGVHRGGETTLDISADLTELGRTPVTVVSAGVKSLLDIPRTLEYLETQGVTVATYGSSQEFPSFFSRHSGIKSPLTIRSAKEAAELIVSNESLGLGSGILIAVPIPEAYAADGEAVETAIQHAVAEASERGISGNEVTPFILQKVNDLTDGKSLEANKALVANNAVVGARIAAELASMKRRKRATSSVIPADNDGSGNPPARERRRSDRQFPQRRDGGPVVIGASIVDHTAMATGPELRYGGPTNVGTFRITYGGVGRNVTDVLTRLGARPTFLSAVGTDFAGKALQSNCSHMDFSKVSLQDDLSTATYCVVLGKDREVLLGIGDMEINDTITPQYISQHAGELMRAPLVVMDGNIPLESVEYVSSLCHEHQTPLWFEPACVSKAVKVCQSDVWKRLAFASPNLNELRSMCAAIQGRVSEDSEGSSDQSLSEKLEECLELCRVLLAHMHCLLVTLGEHGVLVCHRGDPAEPLLGERALNNYFDGKSRAKTSDIEMYPGFSAVHYPACSMADTEGGIVSVSGAGDCLAGTSMAAMLLDHAPDACFRSGLLAARLSLLSHHAVPDTISQGLLSTNLSDHLIPEPNHIRLS